jgi:hypothetical protein
MKMFLFKLFAWKIYLLHVFYMYSVSPLRQRELLDDAGPSSLQEGKRGSMNAQGWDLPDQGQLLAADVLGPQPQSYDGKKQRVWGRISVLQ